MARQVPLRQYANQSQSGTMFQTQRGKEPIDAVMDRCMLLGQRIVAAEQAIKNQATEVATLKETIKNLNEKLEEVTAPSIVKQAKTSRSTARKPSKAKTTTKTEAS